MIQNGLQCVTILLSCHPQVLLQWARHGWENRLSCFQWIHRNGNTCFEDDDDKIGMVCGLHEEKRKMGKEVVNGVWVNNDTDRM